jgi:hypothetical protein
MSIVTITYEAKCKHCINYASEGKMKKDGTPSKLRRWFCAKGHKSWDLSVKDKACDKLEL